MNLILNQSTLLLDRWQTVELVDAAGSTATIDSGCVWVTMDGDRRDIVLGPGQAFKVERNGKTLVHAESPASLRITDGPATNRSGMFLHRLAAAIDRWAIRSMAQRTAYPYY
ncbi:MAG: DUF2917 domain-containing protein [Betaproteobacteria bacterium]